MANAGMGAHVRRASRRAALEHALDYAKQRVQGGVPIFEHQSVRARLFKMFAQVEAARVARPARDALQQHASRPLAPVLDRLQDVRTQTAFEVASDALQIFGGNGLTREYPIEKLLRDARASMIEDGCNDVLGLVAAAKL